MSDQHDRLMQARKAAGYRTKADAARALGVELGAYRHHENGTAGLSRMGERYARFFRVNYDWLMTGRGEMKRGGPQAPRIPIHGLVGAGAQVQLIEDDGAGEPPDWHDFPEPGSVAGLVVKGDSQVPRFRAGEIVLYDPRPTDPASLIGCYAVVQKANGDRLVKILRKWPGENRWMLASHNADPEENVEIVAAWRVLGLLMDGSPAPKILTR